MPALSDTQQAHDIVDSHIRVIEFTGRIGVPELRDRNAHFALNLAVEWSSSTGVVSIQTVHFTTSSVPGQNITERWQDEVMPSEAEVIASWQRPVLTVTAKGSAIGQTVQIHVLACKWVYASEDRMYECWPSRGHGRTNLKLSIKLGPHPVRLRVPHLPASEPLILFDTLLGFKTRGTTGVTFTFETDKIDVPLGPLPPKGARLPARSGFSPDR